MKEFSLDDVCAVTICVPVQSVTLNKPCKFAGKTWRVVGGDASSDASPLDGYMLIDLEPITEKEIR